MIDFFAFPYEYRSFTYMISWFFSKSVDIVCLVFVMNFIFSTLRGICHRIAHGGRGR